MKRASVGVDVGGTKTLFVLADKRSAVVHEYKFKTAPQEGAGAFRRELLEAARELRKIARARGFRIVAVGIASAGQVDQKHLKIVTSSNLVALEDFPIGKILGKALDAPVTMGNDVQMGIYGEHKLGAARGASTALGVFFGTGVGGAAIINGRLHLGASGVGGQVGAVLAQPVGGPKAALSHGIVDRIASKSAIAGEALVMAVKQWAPYLHRRVGTDLSKVTWGMLNRAIRHGDRQVEEMLRARMRVVGIALSSIVNFLNPDMVVLGGGLAGAMPRLVLKEFEAGLREYLAPDVSRGVRVKIAELGGHAVALGVAHAAWERWQPEKT